MLRILLIAAALFLAAPASAQTADDVSARIESLLGDAQEFERAFTVIQAAVTEEDSESLAAYIDFANPLMVDGKPVTIADQAAFEEMYDDLFTDDVVAAVTAQTYETLFVNSDGVMFGDGQLWIGGVCQDEACSGFDVRIIAINHQ